MTHYHHFYPSSFTILNHCIAIFHLVFRNPHSLLLVSGYRLVFYFITGKFICFGFTLHNCRIIHVFCYSHYLIGRMSFIHNRLDCRSLTITKLTGCCGRLRSGWDMANSCFCCNVNVMKIHSLICCILGDIEVKYCSSETNAKTIADWGSA